MRTRKKLLPSCSSQHCGNRPRATVVKLVNGANVRRFLSRNVGIRRECWERVASLKVNPRQKRAVARTCCKFVVAPRDVDLANAPISRSGVHLFGGADETTCACEHSIWGANRK